MSFDRVKEALGLEPVPGLNNNWRVAGKHASKFRRSLRRLTGKLSRAKWWVLHRLHPSHRYHVIRTGLQPGWSDRDVVLEHVIVKVFKDFVEQERPFEQFDTEESRYAGEWGQIQDLYEFFKVNDPDDVEGELLTEKLCQVIRLRGHFWT